MQTKLPISSQMPSIRLQLRLLVRSALIITTAGIASCQANPTAKIEAGTFLNPPVVGERIVSGVSSVVCFNELDAIGMVRTGFFTTSCERFTESTTLMAESVVTRDAGEGPVLMVQTTFREKRAWVPIPWHDWL